MNIKKPLIVLVGLLLLSTTLVGAYVSVSGIRLPDVPVTMNVVDAQATYFNITLSGVPAGNDVTNGLYPGWCSDFGIHMPRNTNLVVTLYDSYGALPARAQDPDWSKVNWILNHKNGYVMMDIQQAFWYLINEKDISGFPNAQALVAAAPNDFTYQPGDVIAIVAVPERSDVQCAFIELVLPEDYEGLTPGYWKNHLDAWHAPYTPATTVGSVFTIPSSLNELSGNSFLTALQYNGGRNDIGAARILLRAAVAALLNAVDPDINYPVAPNAIINDVNYALAHGRTAMLDLKDTLDGYNNLGVN
jgi:hypothetical protein